MLPNGMLIVEFPDGFQLISLKPSMVDSPNQWIDVDPETCRDNDVAIRVARQVEDWTTELKIPRKQCVLAVSSSSAFFSVLPPRATKTSKDSESLRYQLESELPFDAEQLLADYHATPSGTLAVAMERPRWTPLINAWENLGITIQHILPTALMCLQHALQSNPNGVSTISLWQNPNGFDLVRLHDGKLAQWRHISQDLPNLQSEIRWQLSMVRKESPSEDHPPAAPNDDNASDATTRQPIIIQGYTQQSIHPHTETPSIPESSDFHVRWVNPRNEAESPIEPANRWNDLVLAARELLAGKWSPWFDLQRDTRTSQNTLARHQSEWKRAGVYVAISGLIVLGALFWKSSRYEAAASRDDQLVRQVYREAFPGKRIPAAVLTGLRNAKRELMTTGSTANDIDFGVPALELLARLVKDLPEDVPMEVEQIRIQNGRFSIQLDLPTIEDAGKVAAALQQNGLRVSPPSTDTTRQDRVQTQIEGVWSDPAPTSSPVPPSTR